MNKQLEIIKKAISRKHPCHECHKALEDFTESTTKLESALKNLLNDCINFNGVKTSEVYMEEAASILRKIR